MQVFFHFRRSLATAQPFFIPIIFKSSSTSTFLLLRGLPLFLVPSIVSAAICFGYAIGRGAGVAQAV
jgi:hypothetical protein